MKRFITLHGSVERFISTPSYGATSCGGGCRRGCHALAESMSMIRVARYTALSPNEPGNHGAIRDEQR